MSATLLRMVKPTITGSAPRWQRLTAQTIVIAWWTVVLLVLLRLVFVAL